MLAKIPLRLELGVKIPTSRLVASRANSWHGVFLCALQTYMVSRIYHDSYIIDHIIMFTNFKERLCSMVYDLHAKLIVGRTKMAF
jgi:hypothetical protein